MKKITFLFFFLITLISYSQDFLMQNFHSYETVLLMNKCKIRKFNFYAEFTEQNVDFRI